MTVAAADAFGEYDEEEVRTVSKNKIAEDDRYPGAHVEVEGEHGHVETIIGGRARVNFNHPLAGEDVEYDYEVLEEVTDREEKAQGIIQMMLDMELDVWFETDTVEEEQLVESEDEDEDEESEPEYETVEVEKETLYIEATPQLTMNQQWMMSQTADRTGPHGATRYRPHHRPGRDRWRRHGHGRHDGRHGRCRRC